MRSENEREREGGRSVTALLQTRLIDVPSTSSRFYRSNYTPSDPFERFVKEKFWQRQCVPRHRAEMEYRRFGSRVSRRTFRTFRPTANDSFHSREQRRPPLVFVYNTTLYTREKLSPSPLRGALRLFVNREERIAPRCRSPRSGSRLKDVAVSPQ